MFEVKKRDYKFFRSCTYKKREATASDSPRSRPKTDTAVRADIIDISGKTLTLSYYLVYPDNAFVVGTQAVNGIEI